MGCLAKLFVGVTAALGTLVLVVLGYSWLSDRAQARRAQLPIEDVDVSALTDQCEANEVAFEEYWDVRQANVTGIVKDVDARFDEGVLLFEVAGTFLPVRAYDLPRSFLASLSKGDFVAIVCSRVYESGGRPQLSKCSPSSFDWP